jgi:hypothetical protein
VANTLILTAENPDELLNAGQYGAGAIFRVQSSATEAGAYADVTGTGSTPTIAIAAATRSYTAYDPLGVATTWYRVRYENAGATRVSDWTPVFQAGDETGGLICSVYDVVQLLTDSTTANPSRDENILEAIRQVTAAMELYCSRWLVPHPTSPTSTMPVLFDVGRMSRELWVESEQRMMGIRTLSSLGIASSSQPETGGSYTAATLTNVVLRPRPTADGPASKIVFTDTSGGLFYPGYNTVQVVGSFGPASAAYDLQGVGARAALRRVLGKGASGAIAIGPEGTEFLLPDMSGSDRRTLDLHRWLPVG